MKLNLENVVWECKHTGDMIRLESVGLSSVRFRKGTVLVKMTIDKFCENFKAVGEISCTTSYS